MNINLNITLSSFAGEREKKVWRVTVPANPLEKQRDAKNANNGGVLPERGPSGQNTSRLADNANPVCFGRGADPAKKRRDSENTSRLAKSANLVCFRSGAEGTRTLDFLRDRQAL